MAARQHSPPMDQRQRAREARGIMPDRGRDGQGNGFHIIHSGYFFTDFAFHTLIDNQIGGMSMCPDIQRGVQCSGDFFSVKQGKSISKTDTRTGLVGIIFNITAFLLESPIPDFFFRENMNLNFFY